MLVVVSRQRRPEFIHCQPWPSRVYHPVAVGAEEDEVIQVRGLSLGQCVKGPNVVAFDEASSTVAVGLLVIFLVSEDVSRVSTEFFRQ